MEGQITESSKFTDLVDQSLRENIIRLDLKLSGLHAEVVAKIESIKKTGGTAKQLDALHNVSEDVTKAIHAIQELVDAAVSDDLTDKQFLRLNQENIEVLREVFESHLASVSQVKEKL